MKKRGKSSADTKALSEERYRAMVQSQLDAAAERKALRTPRVDSERLRQLGTNSSGWDSFAPLLRDEFLLIWRCEIKSAEQISKVWNSKGFRTGSGMSWTPDTVNFARQHLARIGMLKRKK
jgi:hypothetical protein